MPYTRANRDQPPGDAKERGSKLGGATWHLVRPDGETLHGTRRS